VHKLAEVHKNKRCAHPSDHFNYTRRLEWTIRGDMELQICYEAWKL